jgi:hypothetical protein
MAEADSGAVVNTWDNDNRLTLVTAGGWLAATAESPQPRRRGENPIKGEIGGWTMHW